MGHRRVVVLSPSEPLKGVEAAVRGATDLGEPDFEATVLVENGTSGGVAGDSHPVGNAWITPEVEIGDWRLEIDD